MVEANVEVVIVGSIGLDTVATRQETRVEVLGGSVSYACVAASLYAPTGMVGVVGTDFPEACIRLYEGFGIDLQGLARVPGRTFRWSGIYDDNMISRRTLSTELNVFADFSPALPPAYRNAPFLLLGNIAPQLQSAVLNQVEAPRFVIADTMDLWINTAPEALREVIGRVHMLMLNDEEARLLTGAHNLRRCAAELLAMGPRYIVIKKGEHGAMLISADGLFLVPAFPVDEVVDPTGAGDTFAGAFVGCLARAGAVDEATVRRALLHGAVTASFGVEGFSLEGLDGLHRETVLARLAELEAMTAIAVGGI